MGKQTAKEATVDFLNSARRQLQSGTIGADSDGLSFVEANLNEEHMQAALWLKKKHAMRIDAPNLGNLISIWENALSVSALSEKHPQALVLMVIDRVISEGEFHPGQLLRYFKKNRIAPTTAPPTRRHFQPTIH
jgi:hypothetical protein